MIKLRQTIECKCTKCGNVCPKDEFPQRSPNRSRSKTCIHCTRRLTAERNKAYRERNKDEINKRLATRRAAKRGLQAREAQ